MEDARLPSAAGDDENDPFTAWAMGHSPLKYAGLKAGRSAAPASA